ncbi:tyrosine-type recombinase/integrase [Photobacterium leiognathi]|uniref:tyrosine-type recombinase/integrase n=1 Tax=Photobacterium leiognathi TaxID=553611 RepID=UPI001F310E79|nr:tyrosine-type recombinase/integrase [Photobacterium leiognathi]
MTKVGVNAREEALSKKRNAEIARLEQHAKALITKAFPSPHPPPQQQDFEKKWQRFMDDCNNTLGAKRDYRIVFNAAVKIIRQYQHDYGWSFSPPSYLVSHKEPKQLRTKEWLNRAWASNDFYHAWFDSLLTPSKPDTMEAYRNVLLSLLFHSGQCQNAVVLAFHQGLSNDTLELKHINNHIFCRLELTNSGLNTNCYVEGEKKHIHLAYLHPITLGLLRQWKKVCKKSWSSPNDKQLCCFLRNGAPTDKALPTSLHHFCQAAIYTTEHQEYVELSQALVEYQIGRVKSYSLPEDNLARLSFPAVNGLSHFEFYSDAAKAAYSSSANSNYSAVSNKAFFTTIKACFIKAKDNNNKLSSSEVGRRLNAMVDDGPYTVGETLLLDWFIHKAQTCSPSSLMQYHCSLSRRWLFLTESCDFAYLDSELLEQMYEDSMAKIDKLNSRRYFVARLKDLHQFGALSGVLPEISSELFTLEKSTQHTRAGFVDEPLFSALLDHIAHLKDLNDDEKLGLKSLCIISYRCGLRLSELQKLQLRNVEVSDIGWIDIRDNRYGNNKTASSRRKVPLFPLLLEHEKVIVQQHLAQRRLLYNKQNSLVFSFGHNPYQCFDTSDVSRFVGHTLKTLSGLNHFVFYHLRHSCLSRLQLVFELDEELDTLGNLCRYSHQQRADIKSTLLGQSLQKGYFAIAALAGHESPEMTFAHYFHFSDVIAHLKVTKSVNAILPTQKVILGISSRRLQSSSNNVHLEYLIKKLKITPLKSVAIKSKPTATALPATKATISIPLCYRVLDEYQKGLSIKEITNKYFIEQTVIDKWLANANFIKSLKTNTSPPTSRHFSKARARLILPAPLKSNAEALLINKLILKVREHYKYDKDNFQAMLEYALKNTSVSKSGIYFNDPFKLNTFIQTFLCIVPKSSWRAITYYHQNSRVASEWEDALKGIRNKRGKTSKSTRTTQGAVRLEYISPLETNIKTRGRYKKYSTHTLVYLFHMMGIMMLNVQTTITTLESLQKNIRDAKNQPYKHNALLKL